MTEALWSALIVGGFAMGGQFLMAWLAARTARKTLEASNARADNAADKAAKIADLLTARQDITEAQEVEKARLLKLNNEDVAKTAVLAAGQLKAIHKLVNKEKTTLIEARLRDCSRSVEAIRATIALLKEIGREPDAPMVAALAEAEKQVVELTAELRIRAVQTEAANAAEVAAETAVAVLEA